MTTRCSHGTRLEEPCSKCASEGLQKITKAHTEKETLTVEVNIPQHEERKATALFEHSRKQLIEREGGRCFISGMTAEELGAPLEAHHHPIERCFADCTDWSRFANDCKAGHWGPHAQAFDWNRFFEGAKQMTIAAETPLHPDTHYLIPVDPYLFVDDMTVNGLLIGKRFHTMADSGIHTIPFPDWIAQKYEVEGYQFSPTEAIHHDEV
ncbi:hypothetical protein [Paraburkholderia unamae]|uniref:HNH endonuclease n=1 Tax=Paraburkholderia unamae TaxID=219649 RepID=A0ABX5K6R4_9BURK|nr:hypothetical protein [Paraburkholderia unamae]PVX61219.1 hypothetical protein C7402_14210 [Paraburkholderia unamae]